MYRAIQACSFVPRAVRTTSTSPHLARCLSSSIKYQSTRGGQSGKGFEEVVMGGLATDRGLFVPETIPTFTPAEIEGMRSLSFPHLAHAVMSKYVSEEEIPSADLKDILERSYATFREPDVTPLIKAGDTWILELFHGPTFAFKDVALQTLGNLFEYFLKRSGRRLTILGATSGDTGSAAISGLRGKADVHCFITFPEGRVSEVQERQMTTVPDDNVQCISIKGTFDDCQDIVKGAFQDAAFRDKVSLGAVNSINWARVLAQMTYYFWSYYRLTDSQPATDKVHFSVPTGNFGDILAGYYAKRMGLPVGKLVVATNENDILWRFFESGKYWREDIQETLSPSMDICVSSNFERYLFHLSGDDAAVLAGWMKEFETTGKLTIEGPLLEAARADFMAGRCGNDECLSIISEFDTKHDYLFCPHSACGVGAARHVEDECPLEQTVVLATAHPGKFPAAVNKAVDPLPPAPSQLAELMTLPTRKTLKDNDLGQVQEYMESKIFA